MLVPFPNQFEIKVKLVGPLRARNAGAFHSVSRLRGRSAGRTFHYRKPGDVH